MISDSPEVKEQHVPTRGSEALQRRKLSAGKTCFHYLCLCFGSALGCSRRAASCADVFLQPFAEKIFCYFGPFWQRFGNLMTRATTRGCGRE